MQKKNNNQVSDMRTGSRIEVKGGKFVLPVEAGSVRIVSTVKSK